MNYRSDIDGLRAIAVMSVVAFHTGISILSGGYVGVDVFFVISGYLITTLIYKEVKNDTFTFKNFYKRRAARLLPALTLTLFVVLVFGFVFYNNSAFDNLGKELFFSSFGAANILFAQGVNYFANDEAYQPLIHLWSLGVEEQFYIIWPILLLLVFRISNRLIIPVACVLFFVSLGFSALAVAQGLTKGYFLLHYRAFELLVGVITALLLQRATELSLSSLQRQVLSFVGLMLIVLPMLLLDEKSKFPGFNALWPCLGTALVIAFPSHGLITKVLSNKVLVFVGLISYPLYLYHQPIVSIFYFFDIQVSNVELFVVVTSISVFASWITYKFIEIPIRNIVQSPLRLKSLITISGLCATIPFFAFIGLFIAKTTNVDARFKYLNPFAFEISRAHITTFHQNFKQGFRVSPSEHSSALFVGDSVLQQYILPTKLAMDLDEEQIDTVTRGGCVLLKGVDFVDKFADISCNDIRDKLYLSDKTYDFVVISQAWNLKPYDSSVLNFAPNTNGFEKWSPLLNATVEHFLEIANKVIIIGAHPWVDGTNKIQPSITATKESFLNNLKKLKVSNQSQLESSRHFFAKYEQNDRVIVVEPFSIFCNTKCKVSDQNWSYFSNKQHISSASTEFVRKRILEKLKGENFIVQPADAKTH